MDYDKFVLDLSNESDIDDEYLLKAAVNMLRCIPDVDASIKPMDDTMLDHLEQAREMAEPGSEEDRIITEAWNEIAEHQKETGEWYE